MKIKFHSNCFVKYCNHSIGDVINIKEDDYRFYKSFATVIQEQTEEKSFTDYENKMIVTAPGMTRKQKKKSKKMLPIKTK